MTTNDDMERGALEWLAIAAAEEGAALEAFGRPLPPPDYYSSARWIAGEPGLAEHLPPDPTYRGSPDYSRGFADGIAAVEALIEERWGRRCRG